jgi:hypothetical protein
MGQSGLWRRWLVWVTIGELTGFTAPAVAGAWASGRATPWQLVLMPVAGLVEGAILGASQALVLREALPGFRARSWVLATSLAAGFAWFVGMLPSGTQAVWSSWPWAGVLAAAIPLGAVLLVSIGVAQAAVLPPQAGTGRAWVGWTTLGWCVGLTAFMLLATPLWHPGQGPFLVALIGVGAGLVMAASMAAVTGIGAVRLVTRTRDRSTAVAA